MPPMVYALTLAGVGLALTLFVPTPASGEPSFGLEPGSEVYDTTPLFDAPPANYHFSAPALGLPQAGDFDGLSYGEDPYPASGAFHMAFSVDAGAGGHPGAPGVSPTHPNISQEATAGDLTVKGDVYSSFNVSSGPFGSFAATSPPAPCGVIHSNIQLLDENGSPPFALGSPNVGLGLSRSDDLDALEMQSVTYVDPPTPPHSVAEAPVFLSVDPATAAMLPPLPPAFSATSAADVLVWDPATTTLYNWAPAASLGLTPADDIDGLAVGYVSGVPLAGGFAGALDAVWVSLSPARLP